MASNNDRSHRTTKNDTMTVHILTPYGSGAVVRASNHISHTSTKACADPPHILIPGLDTDFRAHCRSLHTGNVVVHIGGDRSTGQKQVERY